MKNADQLARKRHAGRWNLAFCDGHIESPTLREAFFDQRTAARSRWNRDNEPHFNGQ